MQSSNTVVNDEVLEMNSVKHVVKYFPLYVGVMVITGCVATKPAGPATPVDGNGADAVVARDFVNIMVQIEELSPATAVIRFGPNQANPSEIDARSIKTDNAFGKAFRSAVANGGYTIVETQASPGSNNYVSFSIAEFGDAVDGTTYSYDVSVGEIDFRRIYKLSDNGDIEPFQPMLVRGVDVSQLETDDSIFTSPASDRKSSVGGREQRPQNSTAHPAAEVPVAKTELALSQLLDSTDSADFADSLDSSDSADPNDTIDESSNGVVSNEAVTTQQPNVPLLERPVTLAAPIISKLPESTYDGYNAKSGTIAQSLAGDETANGFETIRKLNIAITGQSNYESLLTDKKDIAEEVLIFSDDSYVLGERNKVILGRMMAEFDPDTDVVSVVGCSTGVTKLANGNAALAIGRANRVKEALLYNGIPHDKIYEEGCWAPQANSTPFPNRGVVVTVKRNVGKS